MGKVQHYPVLTSIFTQTTLNAAFQIYDLASSVLVPVGVGIHDMATHDGIDDAMHSDEGPAYWLCRIVMAVNKYCVHIDCAHLQ